MNMGRCQSPQNRRSARRMAARWVLAAGSLVAWPSTVSAEIFQLKNGATLTGKRLNAEDKQAELWEIETNDGVQLKIKRSDIKDALQTPPKLAAYQQKIEKAGDSAEVHRSATEYCLQEGLNDLAQAHRYRLIELDASDKTTWAALGYVNTPDGYVRRDLYLLRKGLQAKGGRWRVPQDIAIEEARARAKVSQAEVSKAVEKAFRDRRGQGTRAAQAEQYLAALREPLAVVKLREIMVENRGQADPRLRLDIIEILGRIETGASVQTLVDAAMNDPSPLARDRCIALLEGPGRELAVASLMKFLVNRPHAQLSERGNIERAAYALTTLGDERCLERLMDCLLTKHTIPANAAPGSTQATSTSDGAMNFGTGSKPNLEMEYRNAEVLNALIAISRENFDYDEKRWRQWYADTYAPSISDVLRDR